MKVMDTGTGMKKIATSTEDNFLVNRSQIVDMGTVGAQYAIQQITMNAGEGGSFKGYTDVKDPYGVGEWLKRSDETKDIPEIPKPRYKTVTTMRKLTPDEINARNPDQAYIPVTQIPQAATFDMIPNLGGYSTEDYDVAKSAKGFQMAYGERGIKQRGLTEFFENTPDAMDTLNQIGNRAATFLSMKRGKLTPEDLVKYKEYLAQDKRDGCN
jgi:hypothetical protein